MEPRDLPVPGRDFDGIYFAMEFLTQQNRVVDGQEIPYDARISARDRNVLVIGGGDTGSDCVGTAIRQKAKSVTQIEILPKPPEKREADNPWPYFGKILKTSTSHEEGCERRWALSTIRFADFQHRVASAEVEKVVWENINGRYSMKAVPGSKETIETDLVLLAMGFVHPVIEGLVSELGLDLSDRNNIKVGFNHQTSIEHVFAAGDAITGASLVVNAIASGRRVARNINDYLK
jgi:glutamate synthase (NADPH/NADH) small chain